MAVVRIIPVQVGTQVLEREAARPVAYLCKACSCASLGIDFGHVTPSAPSRRANTVSTRQRLFPSKPLLTSNICSRRFTDRPRLVGRRHKCAPPRQLSPTSPTSRARTHLCWEGSWLDGGAFRPFPYQSSNVAARAWHTHSHTHTHTHTLSLSPCISSLSHSRVVYSSSI